MALLLRPVTNTNSSMPAARHSSTAYWINGRSTTVSISLGIALVAGRKRVPNPATGKTALRTRCGMLHRPPDTASPAKLGRWPAGPEGSWATTILPPMTPPPATRAPPHRGIRDGEEEKTLVVATPKKSPQVQPLISHRPARPLRG